MIFSIRKQKIDFVFFTLPDMPYYDEMNGNAYGAGSGVGGGGGSTMVMDTITSNDNLKNNQHLSYNDDELDYASSRSRVMNEIIV